MATESHLQKVLFSSQNPTTEALYKDRCAKLFSTDASKAWIDIYKPRRQEPVPNAALDSSESVGATTTNRDATHQQSGGVIDYLGHCAVPFYRETSVEALKYRIQIVINPDTVHVSNANARMRALFCIVRQKHSWSRLFTSQELLDYVTEEFDFRSRVKDYLLSYGLKIQETDIGGPQLWFGPQEFAMQRQANHGLLKYECAYTLKYVELNDRPDPFRPWAERQTTVALVQSDLGAWILVSPSAAMQGSLDEYLSSLKPDQSEDSFAIHLLLISAALINWEPYLAYLTKETNEGADRAIVTSTQNDEWSTFSIEDRQKLQTVQDRITDMFAMLDSTLDILSSLEEKYHIFQLGLESVAKSQIRSSPIAFAFHERIRELGHVRRKLEALHKRMKATVQLSSSALDLENGHSLRALAEEASNEGAVMRGLTEKATQDAAAVKVITVITMIYLPLTVVANFFSTGFVHQSLVEGRLRIEVADNWWYLAAVGLPLTAATFFVWWAINKKMMLLEALKEVRTRSEEKMKRLAEMRGKKDAATDEERVCQHDD